MVHSRNGSGLNRSLGKIAVLAGLGLSLGAPIVGCATEALEVEAEDVGSLGLKLEVADGVTLQTVTYKITKGDYEKSGTIDVKDAPTISAKIGGIPAGNGYTIELSSSSVPDGIAFTGSAQFNVTAGGTTSVSVRLRGAGTSKNGSVNVSGTLNVAPVIDELTVTPLSVFVGGEVTLRAVAVDPDQGPSSLTYYWSTTEGVIDDPLSPTAKLTSQSPGTALVKLTVSDGETITTSETSVTFVAREASSGGEPPDSDPPNILLIIADDLGSEAVSLYPDLAGNSGQVPIPNIENLAEQGLVFDTVWASPMCSPTRGTIISGLYGYRTGVTTAGSVLPTDTVTVFDRITADSPSNYGQALFGKYHLAGNSSTNLQHVRDLGIPVFRGYMGATLGNPFNWTAVDINGPSQFIPDYAATALTDFSVDYIREHESTRPNDPWFVWLAHSQVHQSSNYVPPEHLHSVDVGNLRVGQQSNTTVVYKAAIQSLDTEIGRLLEDVDLEKTTVIFIGDNGTVASLKDPGSGVRDGKTSVYEGGVRVPLVIAGKGVTRRGREDALVTSTDLYATILELAGIQVGHINNSYSLKPLLTDESASTGRTHSFTELSNGTTNRRYALRDTRYKLVVNLQERGLYDLVADPLERNNLYSSPAHAAVLASLQAEIAELKVHGPAYFP